MQFGPRIRVPGKIGQLGQKVKVGVGKVASTVAPVVSLVNPALGAGMRMAGDALDTTDGKFNIGRAAVDAASTYGAGKLLGKVPGMSQLGNKVKALPGVSRVTDMVHSVGAKMPGLPDRMNSVNDIPGYGAVKNAMSNRTPASAPGAGGGGEGMGLLDKILMGGSVAAATEDAMHRRQLSNKAQAYATGSYDARAPLRQKALASLTSQQKPDDSGLFADPGNVYDRPRRTLAAGVA